MDLKNTLVVSLLLFSASALAKHSDVANQKSIHGGSSIANQGLKNGELRWIQNICYRIGDKNTIVPLAGLRPADIKGHEALFCGMNGLRGKDGVLAAYEKLTPPGWVDGQGLTWDHARFGSEDEEEVSKFSQDKLDELARANPDLKDKFPEYFDFKNDDYIWQFREGDLREGANHREATLYCANKRMRLPTRDEFEAAIKDNSFRKQFNDVGLRYFWTSSVNTNPNFHEYAAAIYGSNGEIDYYPRNSSISNSSARCVINTGEKL